MYATLPAGKARRRPGSSGRAAIGPHDAGRRLFLHTFARAEAAPGYHYEPADRVVEVTDTPGMSHNFALSRIRSAIDRYWGAHPRVIAYCGGGAEAKIELWSRQSERHPDLSI